MLSLINLCPVVFFLLSGFLVVKDCAAEVVPSNTPDQPGEASVNKRELAGTWPHRSCEYRYQKLHTWWSYSCSRCWSPFGHYDCFCGHKLHSGFRDHNSYKWCVDNHQSQAFGIFQHPDVVGGGLFDDDRIVFNGVSTCNSVPCRSRTDIGSGSCTKPNGFLAEYHGLDQVSKC